MTRRVQLLASARGTTPQSIVSEAVSAYLEREEKREAFVQDAMRAWEDYKATGLHLNAGEVDAWIARLEAGEDVDLPDCHE